VPKEASLKRALDRAGYAAALVRELRVAARKEKTTITPLEPTPVHQG